MIFSAARLSAATVHWLHLRCQRMPPITWYVFTSGDGSHPPSLTHLLPLAQIPDCDSLKSNVEILELPQVTGIIFLTSVLFQVNDSTPPSVMV